MAGYRFSMAALMGLVGLLAVGLAALKSANRIWADLMTTLVRSVLLLAILGTMHTAGTRRRFWSGFALFGWAYLVSSGSYFKTYVLDFGPNDDLLQYLHSKIATSQPAITNSEAVVLWIQPDGACLVDGQVTTDGDKLIELLKKASAKKPKKIVSIYYDVYDAQNSKMVEQYSAVATALQSLGLRADRFDQTTLLPDWSSFSRVGHSIFAVLAALVGGFLARILWPRPEESGKATG